MTKLRRLLTLFALRKGEIGVLKAAIDRVETRIVLDWQRRKLPRHGLRSGWTDTVAKSVVEGVRCHLK